MNKYTGIIDSYLGGRMTASEKKQFEELLQSNEELRTELELQQQLLKGIERAGIKQDINKGLKKGALKAKAGKWLTGIVITGLMVALVLAAKNKLYPGNEDNASYTLNEQNTKQWSEADKYLGPEIFIIRGDKDTVIETKGGIILTIPAQAFLNSKGEAVNDEIEIEVKEALTPVDIMKAGLSTTSNGQLLETGGMFYINARKDAANLTIAKSKGIYTSVPNLHPDKKMMLFEGRRGENEQINWVNPKPFENKLNTADILSLNFYPPHFLDSLQRFGFDVKNKKLTDSIYYSFVCGGEIEDNIMDEAGFVYADTAKVVWGNNPYKGAELFKKNCAVCHTTGTQKLTGPGLAGIMDRVPSLYWLKNFILNNEKMIKSGDAYANKVYKENGRAAMTVFEGQLNDQEVLAIVNFINSGAAMDNTGHSSCEIAPSRIHAIWDKKFNNTILATKEFEERLQAIFKTCDHNILDLYVKNLDKRMYEIDSMAMAIAADAKPFETFFMRHDGGVAIKESHMQKLQSYMAEKTKIYNDAALKTMRELYKKENILNEAAAKVFEQQSIKEGNRISETFNEELDINMTEAYRQLGKPRPAKMPFKGGYLSTTLVNTGWYNVDRYVMESTINRTTLDYTDPENGKKAVIRHEPFTVNVTDFSKYDRVVAYLVPDKLSSFQRISGTGGTFKENLNELIKYSAIVFGFKGDDVYCASMAYAKPGETAITLHKMSERELEHYNSMNAGAAADLVSDLKFQLFEFKEEQRKTVIFKREETRTKLWPVVFPCANVPAQQAPLSLR